jgi:hypothetical protein
MVENENGPYKFLILMVIVHQMMVLFWDSALSTG